MNLDNRYDEPGCHPFLLTMGEEEAIMPCYVSYVTSHTIRAMNSFYARGGKKGWSNSQQSEMATESHN